VTNFLTMAETLSSWSGSEALLALLVSTSPEHREMACPTRVPVGSPRPRPKTKAIETALDPAAKKAAMVVYAETHFPTRRS
jgi:hypothetical protein